MAWWLLAINPALGKLSQQEVYFEFKATLGYMVSCPG